MDKIDLPAPGDPYVYGTGNVVESDSTVTYNVNEYIERSSIQRFTAFAPVNVIDPSKTPEADQQEQLAVVVVTALRLMGMDAPDIAEYTSVHLSEVERVMRLPSTQRTFEMILRNIIGNNANNIQGRLASYAGAAVDTVLELMNEKTTRDDVRLKAAQDVLDRSGTNANEFFNVKSEQQGREDELNIVFTDEGGEEKGIKVNLKRK